MTYWMTGTAAAALLTAACAYNANSPQAPAPPTAPEPIVSRPAPSEAELQAINVTRTYNENCGSCHGMNAEGGSAKSLITNDKFDAKWDKPFFDTIKNGAKDLGMDPFGQTMSDQEVWSMVVHIRELQNRGLRRIWGDPKAENGVYHSQRENYKIETVVDSGLSTPWGLGWLPDGQMLVTNKPGDFMIIAKDGSQTTIDGLPAIKQQGQGGLMSVSVHPDYAKNGWIYLSISDPKKAGGGATTKYIRGKLKFEGEQVHWVNQETIFEAKQDDYTGSGVQFGCRLVFDHKGHIFFSFGDRGANSWVQDLTRTPGKLYRLNEDGSIPADNPYAGDADKKAGRLGGIWSVGHRNIQGLVFGLDGSLYGTEHGPRGGDELNKIERGGNAGWPDICFGINYNDSPFVTPWPTADQKFKMPVRRWLPSIAACGLACMNGDKFPNWKGDLFAGGLAGQVVERDRVSGDKLIEKEEIIHGMGRVRDVVLGPDCCLYVVLNEPDKIIRLVPAK